MPDEEYKVPAQIFEKRGLKKEATTQVALELTEYDALGEYMRDALSENEINQANLIYAALA